MNGTAAAELISPLQVAPSTLSSAEVVVMASERKSRKRKRTRKEEAEEAASSPVPVEPEQSLEEEVEHPD